MTNYKLNNDESIIMQTEGATLIEGDDGRNLEEVVLTDQNLILVTRVPDGLFKKKTLLMRCPLDEILTEDNSPKIRADVFNGYQCLRVFYPDTTLVINFDQNSSRLTKRWADGIRKAAAGDFASIQTSDSLGSQLSDLMVDLKKTATPALGSATDFLSNAAEMVSNKVQDFNQKSAQAGEVAPGEHQEASAAVGTNGKLDNQIETLKKLKELLDAGILTQDEFDAKKKEVLGL